MNDVVLLSADAAEGVAEFGYLTIKSRLLVRFVASKTFLGKNWRVILAKNDPFFDTKAGNDFVAGTGQSLSASKSTNVDTIEQVVVAMEKIAGIEHQSHIFFGEPPLVYDGGYMSIRYRLFMRIVDAQKIVGGHWRMAIKAADPFFSTRKGEDFIISASQLMSTRKRISIDRLERVVVPLEKVAGIDVTSVV
jgi:hypothetical protein